MINYHGAFASFAAEASFCLHALGDVPCNLPSSMHDCLLAERSAMVAKEAKQINLQCFTDGLVIVDGHLMKAWVFVRKERVSRGVYKVTMIE